MFTFCPILPKLFTSALLYFVLFWLCSVNFVLRHCNLLLHFCVRPNIQYLYLTSLDAICKDIPVIAGGSVTSWRRTLTSLDGDITCDSDFLWVGNDVTARCFSNGTWQVDAPCNQWHWPNPVSNNCSKLDVRYVYIIYIEQWHISFWRSGREACEIFCKQTTELQTFCRDSFVIYFF